tara:strand:+ start:20786 stop:21424 length:639 start_codon:yes stop_codon:yes gene_type:complete
MEVDELFVLDIDKSVKSEQINMNFIKSIADECRMPLCYGGGIKTLDEAISIISLGVEKISLSSGIIENFELCHKISEVIGKQSLVLVIDVKKNFWNKKYHVYTHNGKVKSNYSLNDIIDIIPKLSVGEVVINSIDRDGTMSGYDYDLVSLVYSKLKIPVTILGGAKNYNDIKNLLDYYKLIGAAAGSAFIYNGRFKAVLINYPDKEFRKLNK